VDDCTGVKINGQFVAGLKFIGVFAFQNEKAHIKGVSVKNPGKILGPYRVGF